MIKRVNMIKKSEHDKRVNMIKKNEHDKKSEHD